MKDKEVKEKMQDKVLKINKAKKNAISKKMAIYKKILNSNKSNNCVKEEDLHTIFSSLEDVVIIVNKNLNIEYVNKAGLRLFKNAEENIIGKKCYEVFHISEKECPLKKSIRKDRRRPVYYHEKILKKSFSVSACV